jgi:hypothetical protein
MDMTMQKITLTIRVDEADKKKWEESARKEHKGLSAWIRDICNVAAPEPSVKEIIERVKRELKPDEDEEPGPFVATVEDPAAMRQCKHGIGAGIYCPRCGRRV